MFKKSETAQELTNNVSNNCIYQLSKTTRITNVNKKGCSKKVKLLADVYLPTVKTT